MTLRSEILKGSLALSFGQVASSGCSFLRNVVLARVLTKADFGVAATFGITVSLLEITGKMAVNRLVVQTREGDDPVFLATAHLFQAVVGLTSAALLFSLAGPLSLVFKVPEARWAFKLLALIPLLKGFSHLDINRMERRMQFGPVVLVDLIPQLGITLAAWPMAVWLGDYRALLWLLLAKWAMTLTGSHLFAQRGYRWDWNAGYLKRILLFGWPLLINGLLLFGIFQGDRLVVGARYTMADLGVYSVAASLSMAPAMLFMGVGGSIMLPMMSRVQDSPTQFRKRYALCVQLFSLVATVFATSMIVAGEPFATLVFGEKYAGAGVIIGWLATAQALRCVRSAPTIAAMAKGDTQNLMISNVFRLSGLGLALIAAGARLDIQLIAASSLAGEVLAFLVAMIRLSKRHGLDLADGFRPAGFATALLALAGILAVLGAPNSGWLIVLPLAGGLGLASLAGTIILFRDFRRQFSSMVQPFMGRLRSFRA